ncbi:MAG: cyclic nucleotide-binding domain-containing protein [Methylobacterium mesophilicum]|nr:cyclic nucleotide-binding domain-containing protein [Methylobacterium mesophilicum]
MALDDDIRILSGVALFEGFAPDQLRLLAFGAERLDFGRGEIVFREGDKADAAFILAEGTVELFRESRGKQLSVGRLERGALIGEYALITTTQRPASAVAAGAVSLLKVDRRSFRRILEEYPDLAIGLYRRIASDFQTMVDEIDRLAPRFS